MSPDSLYITAKQLAQLAGISERSAQNAMQICFAGGLWRGTSLTVTAIEGTGGQGGKSYKLYVPSLPENLRSIWYDQNHAALKIPSAEAIFLPAPENIPSRIAAEVAEWKWKLCIIAPVLAYDKRSRERGAMLTEIAAKPHVRWDGKSVTLALSTLRSWIKKLEDYDETALARKRRAKGLRRVIINRAWDRLSPFSESEKKHIATEIELYTRSLWREGAPSWHKVEALATSKLLEISRTAGWAEADMEICRLGRYYVERFESARKVAIKEQDAKRFADKFEPRIIRNLDDYKTMDIVIGDVHPLDILYETEEGREVTPRMVAWVDWVTGDVHSTIVVLRKGEGIRQEDIARSFVAMVQEWGLPRFLYLDNGSEYKWEEMIEGFRALAGLANAFDFMITSTSDIDAILDSEENKNRDKPRDAIIRAKPYNASAKYAENRFGSLEQGFFCMITGWIGGNRMKKRTHNVGKNPHPFRGTQRELQDAINQALAFYRNTPQMRGHLKGKSPNQARAEFYAQGWKPYQAPYEVFLFAFSKITRCKVHTNGIQVNGEWYYADCLIRHIGSYIEVRTAKWDKSHLVWLDKNEKPHLIPRAPTFSATDTAGAVEQSRRKGLLLGHIKDEKEQTIKLNLVHEIARHNALQEPAPALPKGIPIGITDQVNALADVRKNPPDAKISRLQPGSFRHKKTGAIIDIKAEPVPVRIKQKIDLDTLLLNNTPKNT